MSGSCIARFSTRHTVARRPASAAPQGASRFRSRRSHQRRVTARTSARGRWTSCRSAKWEVGRRTGRTCGLRGVIFDPSRGETHFCFSKSAFGMSSMYARRDVNMSAIWITVIGIHWHLHVPSSLEHCQTEENAATQPSEGKRVTGMNLNWFDTTMTLCRICRNTVQNSDLQPTISLLRDSQRLGSRERARRTGPILSQVYGGTVADVQYAHSS
jgi:hypothetical protein